MICVVRSTGGGEEHGDGGGVGAQGHSGELEHAFPARTRLATLSCAHNRRWLEVEDDEQCAHKVFGVSATNTPTAAAAFHSHLDSTPLTQEWVVALITTRLRSVPGYPAMAARCALLAPGRRAPPARRALVPNGHPCCPPPH
ncbi:hypothetical protein GUJ93_ZPchr0009g2116 [Zizania palustris]|uniref:Uncharacterized protein n=1 Tax=Zizania palustris TaxID=103762 RepID=A0A8J5RRJ9_ZIZPA|nr:hypothetical protein GUJ93_ZPchr0009g2116 [Zizania palustris]